jgi:hypothetical protein
MDEQTVRQHADAYCAALVAGDIERAAQELSDQLRSNLGQLVAMLPMPITSGAVELLERTASGFRAVLHLQGEHEETRLQTRWKERDGRPVIVEVSHVAEAPAAVPAEEEPAEQ